MRRREKRARKSIPRNDISVRWKIAGYMIIFVAVVLSINLFFQAVLLGVSFRVVKREQMRQVAAEITEVLAAEDEDLLAMKTYASAIEYSLGITVYRLEASDAVRLVNVNATGGSESLHLSEERLNEFYDQTVENGGEYFETLTFGGFVAHRGGPIGEFFRTGRMTIGPSQNKSMVYFRLIEDAGSSERYMTVVESSFRPLDTTMQTLRIQFSWVFVVVLFAAAIVVLLMYRRISKPLIRMTESAKELARGHYDVQFSGEGYRETRDLANTLNYASCELSKLDRLQKELIANISHDLRTPLTMIRGYSEVMRDIPEENTPENMQVIIDETMRLSSLVNDLLDLSRIQSGACKPEPEVFNLTLVIREVMLRYETLTKHQGYVIEFESDRDVMVRADRNMLLQVVYNLINNAINYTGEDKRVTVLQEMSDRRVRISVRDTGKGLTSEQISVIWNRYYRADDVHQRAKIGTGLGLSIVKEVLELHGAAYGVNSTPGEGSVFWFELDVIPFEPEQDSLSKEE